MPLPAELIAAVEDAQEDGDIVVFDLDTGEFVTTKRGNSWAHEVPSIQPAGTPTESPLARAFRRLLETT